MVTIIMITLPSEQELEVQKGSAAFLVAQEGWERAGLEPIPPVPVPCHQPFPWDVPYP